MIQELQDKDKSCQEQIERLTNENIDLHLEVEELNKTLLLVENKSTQSNLDTSEKLEKYEKEKKSQINQVNTLTERISKLKIENADLQQQIQELTKSLVVNESSANKLSSSNKKIAELKVENSELQQQMQQLQETKVEFETNYDKIVKERNG